MRISYIKNRKIIPKYPIFVFAFSGDAARILREKTGLKYNVNRTPGNFGYVTPNYILLPIKKITKVNYSGKVYNLQAKTETYTTFAGVVHNCTSKHLLSASMRMMEVGTKHLKEGNEKEAKEYFERSYNLYNLFWALNMKMIDTKTMKNKGLISDETIKKISAEEKGSYNSSDEVDMSKIKIEDKSFFSKMGDLVKKAIDCCRE